MALILNKTTKGISYNYHLIIDFRFRKSANTGIVTIGSYANKEARELDKYTRRFDEEGQPCYDESGMLIYDETPYNLTNKLNDFDSRYEVPRNMNDAELYEYLKTLPEFTGAIDEI